MNEEWDEHGMSDTDRLQYDDTGDLEEPGVYELEFIASRVGETNEFSILRAADEQGIKQSTTHFNQSNTRSQETTSNDELGSLTTLPGTSNEVNMQTNESTGILHGEIFASEGSDESRSSSDQVISTTNVVTTCFKFYFNHFELHLVCFLC